jgi:predicted transcriptional regulator
MNKKKETLTVRFDDDLKKRVVTLARLERRSIANQAAYLIEKVNVLEQRPDPDSGRMAWLCSVKDHPL